MGNETEEVTAKDRTILAAISGILLAIPLFFIAGIIVLIYKHILGYYVHDHWIPYLEEISLIWFPEFLRGIIIGGAALYVTKRLFKSFNVNVVRYSVAAFWSGILLLLVVISVALQGLSLDALSVIALIIGLIMGLWIEAQ